MMAQSQSAAVKRLGAEKKTVRELAKWRELGDEINRLQVQLSVNQSAMAFSFIEGSLVKALKDGESSHDVILVFNQKSRVILLPERGPSLPHIIIIILEILSSPSQGIGFSSMRSI